MPEKAKGSIISQLASLPFGSHICHFYSSKKDLTDILIPFFKTGLEKGEMCLWLVSSPLSEKEAETELKKAIGSPKYEECIKKGQLRITDACQWYATNGKFNHRKILSKWQSYLRKVRKMGFSALRAGGDLTCVVKDNRKSQKQLTLYREKVQNFISTAPMIALCSHSVESFSLPDVISIVNNHQYSLYKRDGRWELIENSEHKLKREVLFESGSLIRVLQELTEDIHSTLDLGKIFKKITDSFVYKLGYNTAILFFKDENKNIFKINALSSKTPLLAADKSILGFPLKDISIPFDAKACDGLESVMELKVKVYDSVADLAYPLLKKRACQAFQKVANSKKYIIAPLELNKEVSGGIFISSPRESISKAELHAVQSICYAAATAIRNARLFKEVEEAREAQRKYAEDYRGLFENAHDAIMIFTPDKEIILDANQRACEMYHFSRKELMGMSLEKLSKDVETGKKRIKKVLEKGELHDFETVHFRKDGSEIQLEINAALIDFKGRRAILSVNRDVTARKKAEEELRLSEEKYKAIFDGSRDAIFITGEDSRFVEINKAACSLSGYSREELLKMGIPDLHEESDLYAYKTYFHRIMSGEQITSEAKILRKDGRKVDTEFSNKRVKIGDKPYMHTTARDITERKRAQEKIKDALKEKEVMLQEIHHRVKNNMQIISSLLRLQSRNAADEETRDMFLVSQGRIRSMALIHDSFYRSDDYTKIDFGPYIKQLVTHLMALYQVSENQIRMKIDIGPGVYLNLNSAIPCGLLINELVANALKHAFPEGKKGKITVEMKKEEDGKFKLLIKDDGIGLPDEVNLGNPQSLGIQIVTDLVHQLKGTIQVTRHPGTEFRIKF